MTNTTPPHGTDPDSTDTQTPERTNPQVTLTRNTPQETTTITLTGQPFTELWSTTIGKHFGTYAENIDAIIEATGNTRFPDQPVQRELKANDEPTGSECLLAAVLSSWSSYASWEQQCHAASFIKNLGNNIYTDIEDVQRAATLLDADTPITFELTHEFKNQRADQRRDVCRVITAIAANNDVYLHAPTTLLERWVANTHTPDLPGSLREQCNSPTTNQSQKHEQVTAALNTFDVDGGRIELLRFVAETPNETRTLEELKHEFNVNPATIHNRLHHLREHDLLSDTVETSNGQTVYLTSTGRAYLDAVYESSGVQTTIEESLIASGKSFHNMPCNPADTREEGGWNRNRLPQLHQHRSIPQHRHVAARAVTEDTDIAVVDTDVDLLDDRAAPGTFVDHDDRVVHVSAEYDNPMQYWVTVARALANPQIWSYFLTAEKLNSKHGDKFMSLFEEHKFVLRQLRCLGYTPDDVETIEAYRDQIVSGLEALLHDTKRLTNGEYPEEQSRGEFRASITSDAHGIAGIMAHLLDLVGVDVIRELRVPRFRKFTDEQRRGLVETVGHGAAVQSVFSDATAYRQLFEQRNGKREQMIEVSVDGKQPFSELIGSFVIVGDFKSQEDGFVKRLRRGLSPGDVVDDAPEFNLRVRVKHGVSRREYAVVVTRMLRLKGLRPTQQAVSVIAGVVNSPFEAGEALQYLAGEETERPVDASEVRVALRQLRSDDVLRGVAVTKQRVVMALLEADEVLGSSALADAAGVSERSLRTHVPELVRVGLVSECCGGYRFELSFDTSDERVSDRYPSYVASEHDPVVHKAAKAIKTGVKHHFRGGVSDAAFPTWAGRQACRDLRALQRPGVWLRGVLPLLWGVACRETYRVGDGVLSELCGCGVDVVREGPEIGQCQLHAFTNSEQEANV